MFCKLLLHGKCSNYRKEAIAELSCSPLTLLTSLTLPPYITNIDLIDMKGQSVGPETRGLTLDPGCKVRVIRPIMRSSENVSVSDDPDLLPRSPLKIMMEKLKASQAKF